MRHASSFSVGAGGIYDSNHLTALQLTFLPHFFSATYPCSQHKCGRSKVHSSRPETCLTAHDVRGDAVCTGCLIPWVGEASAYLGSRTQHEHGCKLFFESCGDCTRKEIPERRASRTWCDQRQSRMRRIVRTSRHRVKSIGRGATRLSIVLR